MISIKPISGENFDSVDFQAGALLLVNKPKDWTSFDVVNKIRWAIRKKLDIKKIKVGHAGTLDPMATGLLIICTGKFTKKLSEFQALSKLYDGTMELGASTPSYDAESEIDKRYDFQHISKEMAMEKSNDFRGIIAQVPPMFSAIKVKGQALYKLARKGQTIERKSRSIEIFDFRLTKFELPFVDFSVHCSKGTYIRSLAHDFGHSLNSGAYLTALCRTGIGDYSLNDCWDLEELIKEIHA